MSAMQKRKTAIIYARVSSARQADDGLPVDSQIEQGYKRAETLEADVLKVFTDAGISGRTDARPAFQDAVNYCKAYSVDYFICWSTSRFARNQIDAGLYKRSLEKAGCRVVYVSIDIDNRTDSGWMLESFLAIFDEHYSRQVSSDTLRSMLKNARDGYFNGGRLPLGYKTYQDGKRKRLMIDQDEAQLVRDIFKMCQEGNGAKLIAMHFNDRGLLNRGRKWQKNTVTMLLKNDIYSGNVVFNRTNNKTGIVRPRDEWIITKSHEAIIEEEKFMAVQAMISSRAPVIGAASSRSGYVFTGMLRCGTCNQCMQMETANGRSAYYHYYNCSGALKGKGCSNRRMTADELDDYLVSFILEKVLTRENIVTTIKDLQEGSASWLKERAKRRTTINVAMRTAETSLRNLYSLLELHGKDAPNLQDLTSRLRELKDERMKLEQQLINLEQEHVPEAYITDYDVQEMCDMMIDVVKTSTDPKKLRQFFASFIKSIEIRDSIARIEYHPDRIVTRSLNPVHSEGVWLPDRVLLRTKSIEFDLPSKFIRKPALAA
jgi:site-specific DNA recombinase